MELVRNQRGLGLLELIVAISLLAVVLMGATSIFLSMKKTGSSFYATESSLMEAVLAANEEMVQKITVSNSAVPDSTVAPPNSKITIKVDEANTPANTADDVTYVYALDGRHLTRKIGAGAAVVIAKDITSLTFAPTGSNTITIDLEVQPAGGGKEHIKTTATARGRSSR